MKIWSVQDALKYVADNPEPTTDVMLEQPVYELIARALFQIANNPDARVRGSMRKALRAQKLIMNRLVGTRRAGTHPVVRQQTGVEFADLTAGLLDD